MAKKPFIIRNDDELKAAVERRDELLGGANGNDGERELKLIADAIKVYTDAMRVLRNVDHDEPDLQAAQLRGKE